jgi:hypothetical protein
VDTGFAEGYARGLRRRPPGGENGPHLFVV